MGAEGRALLTLTHRIFGTLLFPSNPVCIVQNMFTVHCEVAVPQYAEPFEPFNIKYQETKEALIHS